MSSSSLQYFCPVILFHDRPLSGQGALHHSTAVYADPVTIELHKRRIDRMLDGNCRVWMDHWNRPSSPELSSTSSPSPSPVPAFSASSRRPRSSTTSQTPPSTPPKHVSSSSAAHTPKRQHHHHHHHHTPPTTSSSTSSAGQKVRRRRGNLPKDVTAILREWLSNHKKHPYPTEDEKSELAKKTGLNLNQVSNWFINARRRILGPMLKEGKGSAASLLRPKPRHSGSSSSSSSGNGSDGLGPDEPDSADSDHDLDEDEDYHGTTRMTITTPTRRSKRRFHQRGI